MTLDWRRESEEYRWLAALGAMTAVALIVAGWFSHAAGLPPYGIVYLYFRAVFNNAQYALGVAVVLLSCAAFTSGRSTRSMAFGPISSITSARRRW